MMYELSYESVALTIQTVESILVTLPKSYSGKERRIACELVSLNLS